MGKSRGLPKWGPGIVDPSSRPNDLENDVENLAGWPDEATPEAGGNRELSTVVPSIRGVLTLSIDCETMVFTTGAAEEWTFKSAFSHGETTIFADSVS